MRFSHFFIDRPIFAAVISIVITLIGGLAYFDAAGRAVSGDRAADRSWSRASYPGASAEVVAETVATPLEQEINGVEDMLYMVSQSTGDGDVPDHHHLRARHRPRRRRRCWCRTGWRSPSRGCRRRCAGCGVTTRKNSPDLMMVIHLNSPDGSLDQLYISNYATLQIKDVLARLRRRRRRPDLRRARLLRCASGSTPSGWPRST